MALTSRASALLGALAVVAVALGPGPAHAGVVAVVVEAPTPAELSIAVSRHAFAADAVDDVVLAPSGRVDLMAVAAGLIGGTSSGAPLFLVPAAGDPGHDGFLTTLRAEVDRVTGGPDGPEPPTVWLVGVDDPGLESAGYTDRRSFSASASDAAGQILDLVLPGGNESRVLLYPQGDIPAGALTAAFGASYGIAVVPVPAGGLSGDLRDNIEAKVVDEAIVVGAVTAPPGLFTKVVAIDGAGAAQLSVRMADTAFATEKPDGLPTSFPLHPVAADGFGPEPAPAILASVVSAQAQDEGRAGPLLLVDGRPAGDLASSCASGIDVDAPSSCALAAAAGDTTVIALTGTTHGSGTAVVSPPAKGGASELPPKGGPSELPATGGASWAIPAAALALAATAAWWLRELSGRRRGPA